ncbi:MAG: hypothetical protein KH353_06875 [Clostridium sp.]|nr:hypothetical protein [Clostridium sp.]
MKKRQLFCCAAAAVLLCGCALQKQEECSETGQNQIGYAACEEREKEERDKKGKIEEKRQFADGFGVIEAGSPRVYQLAEQETPFTESELARADLVFAAQQEGKFWFTAVITDYSVEEADKETALREIGHNPAYFKIEETGEAGQEIYYGYSHYLELINDTERTEPVRMEGKNVEQVQYAPNRLTQKSSSLSRLPSGQFIMNFGYFMEDPYSWLGEPEGEYHLYLPGFEKPLAFEMEAAPTLREEQKLSGEVLSKEFISGRDFEKEMSGAEERDGYGLIVRARQEGERITAEFYTWSDQGYQVNPQKVKLYYRPAESGRERTACSVLWENPYIWQEEPAAGGQGGIQGMQTVFELPEEAGEGRRGSLEAVVEGIRLVGAEESQTVSIPVPRFGETKFLEEKVSFRDGQLSLLQVTAQQRTEEEQKESGIDAEVLLRVSASASCNLADRRLTFVLIDQGEALSSYAKTGWPEFPEESGDVQTDTVMTGFYLLGGDSKEYVKVRLYAPTYWCPETVIIPLKIDNL